MNWWKRKNKPKLFNKDVGLWDLKNTTDIDNIAYYLYCKKDVIYLTDTYDIVDGSERGEIIYTNNGWSRILLSHNNFVNQDYVRFIKIYI